MLALGEWEGAWWKVCSLVAARTGLDYLSEYFAKQVDREMARLSQQVVALATAGDRPSPAVAHDETSAPDPTINPRDAMAAYERRFATVEQPAPSAGVRTSGGAAIFQTPGFLEPGDPPSRISYLRDIRQGFVSYGGGSIIDKDVVFTDVMSVIRYVPKALLNATLTPNPFTRFATLGPTGQLRTFSMVEVALTAAVLVLAAWRLPVALRLAPSLTVCILLYAFILHAFIVAVILGLIVPQVGLLFRFRLGFVLPLCLLAIPVGGGRGETRR